MSKACPACEFNASASSHLRSHGAAAPCLCLDRSIRRGAPIGGSHDRKRRRLLPCLSFDALGRFARRAIAEFRPNSTATSRRRTSGTSTSARGRRASSPTVSMTKSSTSCSTASATTSTCSTRNCGSARTTTITIVRPGGWADRHRTSDSSRKRERKCHQGLRTLQVNVFNALARWLLPDPEQW